MAVAGLWADTVPPRRRFSLRRVAVWDGWSDCLVSKIWLEEGPRRKWDLAGRTPWPEETLTRLARINVACRFTSVAESIEGSI